MKKTVFLLSTALTVMTGLARPFAGHAGETTVKSPDGRLSVRFELTNGRPVYRVDFKGRTVIRPSTLGFELQDGPLKDGFMLVDTRTSAKDETWTPVYGERSRVRNHYRELAVTLQQTNAAKRTLRVIFRAFDHAVAFRYEWPEQPSLKEFNIMDELTEFVFPASHMALWQPAYRAAASEQLYARTTLNELYRQTLPGGTKIYGDPSQPEAVRAVTTPLTMETGDGLFLAIHEADLTDYAGMELKPQEHDTLKCDLAPWSDGIRVRATAPCVSPWRLVMISDKLSDLVELTSETTMNLNPPSRIADTSWIKPGKYVGIWWGIHLGKWTWAVTKPGESSKEGLGATTENTRAYIDFAARYGFSGVLVEGWNKGWALDWVAHSDEFSFTQPNPEYDLTNLAAYAHSKGVDLISHHETGCVITNYENQVEAAFAQCQALGIHHVKSGYVGNEPRVRRYDEHGNHLGNEYLDGQYMVRHYRQMAELAAKYQIMLDAHEPIKDTGERRTWPNFMTREGARGMEWNAWATDGGNPPNHDVNLVFTRFLSGPFDFTPGVLQVTYPEYKEHNRVNTTMVKQLALYVAFYSPLQMAADLPENYEKHPDVFQFLRDVPADWEETRMLNGRLGGYVTLARKRRGGDDWFIGSITDDNKRTLDVPLTFLDRGRKYVAEIYRDADDADWKTNPYAHVVEKRIVGRDTVLQLKLAPGGGEAIRLRPATPQEISTPG